MSGSMECMNAAMANTEKYWDKIAKQVGLSMSSLNPEILGNKLALELACDMALYHYICEQNGIEVDE